LQLLGSAPRLVDEGLVTATAHPVNPFAEVIEDFVVQPDGDPGLARLWGKNCASFSAFNCMSAFWSVVGMQAYPYFMLINTTVS
jgi:hypothetical protein